MGKRKESELAHGNQLILKYSQIIGNWFYNIGLSDIDREMVDVYFFCSSHHFHRWKEATKGSYKKFHLTRHRLALKELVSLIYQNGDFSKAYDPSFKGLDKREAWNPENLLIPDAEMFNSQVADHRYAFGVDHPFDLYLTSLALPVPRAN